MPGKLGKPPVTWIGFGGPPPLGLELEFSFKVIGVFLLGNTCTIIRS